MGRKQRVSILVFDGATLLDLAGHMIPQELRWLGIVRLTAGFETPEVPRPCAVDLHF
jgi:hypothetical protein